MKIVTFVSLHDIGNRTDFSIILGAIYSNIHFQGLNKVSVERDIEVNNIEYDKT